MSTRSGTTRTIPHIRSERKAENGDTEVEIDDLEPYQLIKVDFDPKISYGLCKSFTPSSNKPSTIEKAWSLDPNTGPRETRLDGTEFFVVTATEVRRMVIPFALATDGDVNVTYEERVPRTVPGNSLDTSHASGNGKEAPPTSRGTLLAATASKNGGSDTPAISLPGSKAPSFLEQLSKARWDSGSKRRP